MKSRVIVCLSLWAVLNPLVASSQVSVVIAIRPPPPLPVYVQPPVPAPGYLWTPGYWGWSALDNDYYWVPGTWVLAPRPGYLWTPGYWGYYGGSYRWNGGYWGTRVGFYGGVNYGFGYVGYGYQGGRWNRGVFQYNQAVNNVNTTVVRNVYNTKVVNVTNVTNVNRVSFNGGDGGIDARPTQREENLKFAKHIEPTADQQKHEDSARKATMQRASVNRGAPQVAATPKPAELNAAGVARASNRDTVTAGPTAGAVARPQDQTAQKHTSKQARREAQASTTPSPDGSGPGTAAARHGKPESGSAMSPAATDQGAARREQKAARSAPVAPENAQRNAEQKAVRHEQRAAHGEQPAAGGARQAPGEPKPGKGERQAVPTNSSPHSALQPAQLQ